ncbi:hypothetical protein DXZ20_12405 [Leptolyngbyaceae cyanobacterium CCMR0081]|uniref:Uncharacterized protein n=2 Tax=Adonisia TaxID=2950183 RepID=A0A6M0RLB8_9CYAN|nr:hypothetical protein [Adonisia turfae CCMR0081]
MEHDAYDEWEAIASTLYEQIVLSYIRYSVKECSEKKFPVYDLKYSSYREMAYIEVTSKDSDLPPGPFVGFLATEPTFEKLKFIGLQDRENPHSNTILTATFEECEFQLKVPVEDNQSRPSHE